MDCGSFLTLSHYSEPLRIIQELRIASTVSTYKPVAPYGSFEPSSVSMIRRIRNKHPAWYAPSNDRLITCDQQIHMMVVLSKLAKIVAYLPTLVGS